MSTRIRVKVGLTAVAFGIAAAVGACSTNPPRTVYCYWFGEAPWGSSTTMTTTTTTTTVVPTSSTTTTIDPSLEFRCLDRPWEQTVPTTLAGYPAPIPAGTQTVK